MTKENQEQAAADAVDNAESAAAVGDIDTAKKELDDAADIIADARKAADETGDDKLAERLDSLESRIDDLTILVSKIVPREDEVIEVPAETVPAPKPEPEPENDDAPIDKPATPAAKKRYFV